MRQSSMRPLHLGTVVLAAVLIAASAAADGNRRVRPFAANFDVVSIAVPDVDGSLGCTPGDLKVVIDGAGWASFMGVVTDRQSHCVHLATGEAYNGDWEFTDAEGSTLFGTYVPTMKPTICMEAPVPCSVMLVIGTYTIDGGTGRFARVLPGGGGDARGLNDIVSGEASIYLGGVIVFDKKKGDGGA